MKRILWIILAVCCPCAGAAQSDTLLLRLNRAISSKENYTAIKEKNIAQIKRMLNIEELLPRQRYEVNSELIDQYRKYCADSAIIYTLINREIARQLNNPELIAETGIRLAWLYSTTGLYIEASELLHNINRQQLPKHLLPACFEAFASFCSHYGQSNSNQHYYRLSDLYRDSLLMVLDTASLHYRIEYAARQMFGSSNSSAEAALINLLNEAGNAPDRGYIAWLLGYMYRRAGNVEMSKKYFVDAVVSDIEHCIKDNASFQSLALVLFEQGDIASAYRVIHSGFEDALFCNVRHRMSEASTYYPIIYASYRKLEKKQMKRLHVLLAIISLMLMALASGMVVFYRQNRKLMQMRSKLSETNHQLNDLNHRLSTANSSLHESNLIKEEYIAHFFNVCSAYVDKLESCRRLLNKNVRREKAGAVKMLDSDTIENELEELYRTFDTIFLNLYPTFVDDFNAVRPDTDKIVLKHGEQMNTELRIFALIRLGIGDSVKIAAFLRYSLSAIYNYRVKARKCCNADKKTFEELLMKMGRPPEL